MFGSRIHEAFFVLNVLIHRTWNHRQANFMRTCPLPQNTTEREHLPEADKPESTSKQSSWSSSTRSADRNDVASDSSSVSSSSPSPGRMCKHSYRFTDSEMSIANRLIDFTGVRKGCSSRVASRVEVQGTADEVPKAVYQISRCLRFVRLCDYEAEEIATMVAHAAVYLRNFLVNLGEAEGPLKMGIVELSYAVSIMIYLGHSHAIDKNVPLKVWHQQVFAQYCTMKVLNTALMGLFGRLEFKLRVGDDELQQVASFLDLNMA
eukprot:gnl/TRDRNA2_/TRDRNA2_81215_c1_seq1.p1 gnl/TRDRNA2_/TRDRNA2_81215_c1~~gnl/TRDRNA2_/TRDRNA2_81215_c1_seq1.p1  ORF type:complete len:263 (-),score=30.90 gnl/TRDRNA2_/TRDRNA2_81215_c1_seq1:156-944(-)